MTTIRLVDAATATGKTKEIFDAVLLRERRGVGARSGSDISRCLGDPPAPPEADWKRSPAPLQRGRSSPPIRHIRRARGGRGTGGMGGGGWEGTDRGGWGLGWAWAGADGSITKTGAPFFGGGGTTDRDFWKSLGLSTTTPRSTRSRK